MFTRTHCIIFALGLLLAGTSAGGVTYLLVQAVPEKPAAAPVKTVDYYKAHRDVLIVGFKACKNDPGGLGVTPNCINARAADWDCMVNGGCAKSAAVLPSNEPFAPKYIPSIEMPPSWAETLSPADRTAIIAECNKWRVLSTEAYPQAFRTNCRRTLIAQ